MLFQKDNIVKNYNVVNGFVQAAIQVNNLYVSCPSLEMFLSQGWEIVEPTPEEQTEYNPTRSEVIESYIREHGYPTYGAELAVINNYTESPAEYLDDWQAYMGVRRAAKEYADTIQAKEE